MRSYGEGMNRPDWARANALLQQYYDTEWGFEVRDTPGVYERLVLEGFQAGLAWLTVLRKRDAFRAAFAGFDPAAVAGFDEDAVARLLADPGIIRNEQKIRAAITNARATVAMAEAGEDLAELVWSHRPADPTEVSPESPAWSAESKALSRALKQRGFAFVGPVTLYAAMEAIGVLQHRVPLPTPDAPTPDAPASTANRPGADVPPRTPPAASPGESP